MTELRRALRDAVATPPESGVDMVAVVAEGQRSRTRRRRWVVAAIAAATATVVIAGVSAVSLVTRDAGDGGPEPAPPVPPNRIEDLTDPVDPPRDFAADPVRGFEEDAPLLREGDIVLGAPDDDLWGAYLTEDLQVLAWQQGDDGGSRYGLIDPATPIEVDWLPRDPRWAEEALPLCGFWVGDRRGGCVQGARTLWFYVFNEPGTGRRIDLLRFDRVTRDWSAASHGPRLAPAPSAVEAGIVANDRVVIDGPAGRRVVRLDREPFCGAPSDLYPRSLADTGVGLVRVEGELVTVEYYCTSVPDPGGGGANGLAVLNAEGEVLVHLQDYDGGHDVIAGRLFAYHGMLVDLTGGRVYRLLAEEPRRTGDGWLTAYVSVMTVQDGLITWSETPVVKVVPRGPVFGDRTVHLTPLP